MGAMYFSFFIVDLHDSKVLAKQFEIILLDSVIES